MRRASLLGLVLIIALHEATAEGRERTSKDCDPADRTYFPVKEPIGRTGLSQRAINNLYCDLFSRHLRSMNEPPLLGREQEKNARAFRLMALPDTGKPYAIRLELGNSGDWQLIEKATNGAGPHFVGTVVFEESRTLTNKETVRVSAATDADNIWFLQHIPVQLSSWTSASPDSGVREPVILGDGWLIFEFVQNGRYLVRVRRRDGMVANKLEEIVQITKELSIWQRKRATLAD